MNKLQAQQVISSVNVALKEDLGWGDMTSQALLEQNQPARLALRSREAGIACGLELARETFLQCDPNIQWQTHHSDGQTFATNDTLAIITGPALALLAAERVALNFLQHLSGIATLTQKYVQIAHQINPHLRVCDTRKTIPGLRTLAKYAVSTGGGHNNRFSLADGILVKDNHLAILENQGIPLAKAIPKLKQRIPHGLLIQVEVDTLQNLKIALKSGADALLLDNMTINNLKIALQIINKKIFTEASGNIRLHNLPDIAASGVNAVSVGALTQSAPSVDIAADWEEVK